MLRKNTLKISFIRVPFIPVKQSLSGEIIYWSTWGKFINWRNTSKTLAYEVKTVSSASELNKDMEDISENEDFFDELQANRSPYKPILEDITDDEDDLFHLVDELDLWILTIILCMN